MADQLALEFGSVELVKGKGGRSSVRRVTVPAPGPNFGVDSEPAALPALPDLSHWLHERQAWRLRESDNAWICAVCHPDPTEERETWTLRV